MAACVSKRHTPHRPVVRAPREPHPGLRGEEGRSPRGWLSPGPAASGIHRTPVLPGGPGSQPGFEQKWKLLAVVNSFTHVSCRGSCVCEVVSSPSLGSWLVAGEAAGWGVCIQGSGVFSGVWGSARGGFRQGLSGGVVVLRT